MKDLHRVQDAVDKDERNSSDDSKSPDSEPEETVPSPKERPECRSIDDGVDLV